MHQTHNRVTFTPVAGRLPPWPPGALFFGRPTGPAYAWRVVDESPEFRCSAKGCHAPAAWQLRWNNPKLHEPDHRKIWLACVDHRQYLATFLDLRGFLREVTPFGATTDAPIS